MSIINQALKKAQREQLLHATPHQPHTPHRPPPRLHLLWWFIGVGCIVLLGAGTIRYGWRLPATQQPEKWQRPRIARQALAPILPPPPITPSPVPTKPDSTMVIPTPTPVRPTQITTAKDRVTPSAQRPPQPDLPPPPTPQAVAAAVPLTAAPVPTRSKAQDLLQRATELQERDQPTRAITLLQQAVDLDATYKEAYSKLGNLYYKQQEYRQAMDSFQKVLTLDPGDVKAHNNLGSTYLRLNMDEQAREVLHKAINIDQTYGLAYYNLACAYARTGDRTTTARYLKQAIAIEPKARDWAQTDDDFRRVRNTPELRQLLGPTSW